MNNVSTINTHIKNLPIYEVFLKENELTYEAHTEQSIIGVLMHNNFLTYYQYALIRR